MRVLRTSADFRLLWLGSSLSLVGDGMTFVALTWLVLDQPGGAGRLGLLTVCFTLPVFAGGLLTGPLLDRFDKRYVLAADSLVRGAAMASVPLSAAAGEVPHALPYVVAALYGLCKMVPLAGFPAAIPDLVAEEDRDAANALESISFSVAGMLGPALGGLLIGWFGSAAVLALDAATYVVFAATALAVRRPLPAVPARRRPLPAAPIVGRPLPAAPARRRLLPAALARRRSMAAALLVRRSLPVAGRSRAGRLSPLLHDRVLVVTTAAFMAFNVAAGMLLVTGPWLAKTRLDGGAPALGLLLAALAVGELIGSVVAGAWSPGTGGARSSGADGAAARSDVEDVAGRSDVESDAGRADVEGSAGRADVEDIAARADVESAGGRADVDGVRGRVVAIAVAQSLAATAFLVVPVLPYAGFLLVGLFSAPMTVWAQSLRMRRIPAHLRGRGFAILRTLMQATPPAGAALAAPLLDGGRLFAAAAVMAALAGLPVVALLAVRRTPPARLPRPPGGPRPAEDCAG